MARQRSYSFMAMFASADERDRWIADNQPPGADAPLPDETADPGSEAEATAAEEADPPPFVIDAADTMQDGEGGYFEGAFARVMGPDKEAVAALATEHGARCCDPRMSGFAWSALAEICTGIPEDFATDFVEGHKEMGNWQPEVGGGGEMM